MPVKHDLIGKGRKQSKVKAKRPEVNVTVSSSRLLFLRQACVALRLAYYNVLLDASLYPWEFKLLGDSDDLTDFDGHNSYLAQWLAQVTAQQMCVCYFYLEYRYNDGLG